MSSESDRLRVRRLLGDSRGAGGRRTFTREGRRAASELAHAARAAGESVRGTAKSLGVDEGTLFSWMRQFPSREASSFVPVLQVAAAPSSSANGSLVVTHGSGARVEGLSVEDVAYLFRRLG